MTEEIKYDKKFYFYSDGDRDHDMFLFLQRAAYLARRTSERELMRYDISPEQIEILFVAHALKNQGTPAQISRFVLRKRHTISVIVERMEKLGLIKRIKDLEYKNMIRICLTEKGEECNKLASKRGNVHRIMKALNDEEREQLYQCLNKIMIKSSKELGLDHESLLPRKSSRKEDIVTP